MNKKTAKKPSSSGHVLGQIIGNWFEEYFAYKLLLEIAKQLDLYLDSRYVKRKCRESKIAWKDFDGNSTNYDFVLELDGTVDSLGIPIAFFETFWRRGARHSKDKARDDSGKLKPMFDTYPTLKVLAIIAAGDFTEPAQILVRSQFIDLFYIEKNKILEAWNHFGVEIDYPDNASEDHKSAVLEKVKEQLKQDKKLKEKVANQLCEQLGKPTIHGFQDRIRGILSSLPIKFTLSFSKNSNSYDFARLGEVAEFLKNFVVEDMNFESELYVNYEILYSEGTRFTRKNIPIQEAQNLNNQMSKLIDHMEKIYSNN